MGPVIDAIRYLGATSVHFLQLDSRMLKKASPMNGGDFNRLSSNGQNLPWLVDRFKQADPLRFSMWIEHLKSLLNHLEDIDTREREDDRHRYLLITTTDGVDVPSWGASEGTLRLIALTLLAYYQPVSDPPIAYLLEEPENGIHPLAVEGAYQSLSSVYSSQIFIASHSPTLLQSAKPKNILCFSRTTEGVEITPGHRHPYLNKWQSDALMDVFFATDILS
jgi:predicted ATPase